MAFGRIRIPKLPAEREETLHKAVAQHARWHLARDVFWFHPPNGGARSLVGAVNLKRMGTKAGVPDLVFVRHGRVYFMELKAPKGRVSEAQNNAHAEISRSGAPIAICRNLDDVLAYWRRWGLTAHPSPEDAVRRAG